MAVEVHITLTPRGMVSHVIDRWSRLSPGMAIANMCIDIWMHSANVGSFPCSDRSLLKSHSSPPWFRPEMLDSKSFTMAWWV